MYKHICALHAPSFSAADENFHTIDRILFDEHAESAYKLFTKFSAPDSHKTYCIVLICLDAIMSSIIDLYKPIKNTDAEQKASETNFIVNWDEAGQIFDGDYRKKNFWEWSYYLGSCGRISCSTTADTKLIHEEAYKTFLDVFKLRGHANEVEAEVSSNGTEHGLLNRAGTAYKIAFRYHGSQLYQIYYIAVQLLVFQDPICFWIDYASGCCNLLSTWLGCTIALFDITQVLSVVIKSSKDVEDQKVSKYFGGIRNEDDTLCRQCLFMLVTRNLLELAMTWYDEQCKSYLMVILIADMGFLVVRVPPAVQASGLSENVDLWPTQNSERAVYKIRDDN